LRLICQFSFITPWKKISAWSEEYIYELSFHVARHVNNLNEINIYFVSRHEKPRHNTRITRLQCRRLYIFCRVTMIKEDRGTDIYDNCLVFVPSQLFRWLYLFNNYTRLRHCYDDFYVYRISSYELKLECKRAYLSLSW